MRENGCYGRHLDRVFILFVRYLSWKIQLHRRVSEFPRLSSAVVFPMSKWFVKCTVRILGKSCSERYTDADPYKIISIDPNQIERTTGEIFSKRRGWVVKGDWDRAGTEFMERSYPKAIWQRFVDGLAWEETVLFRGSDHSVASQHAESIDRLYERIKNSGYRSQRELLQEDPEAAWDGLNDAMHPLANEISVDIGRDGELLWNICGQHRLAIAKVLDVDEVPVQVFRRHHEWQEIRDRARRGEEIPERFCAHPDLQDLFGED